RFHQDNPDYVRLLRRAQLDADVGGEREEAEEMGDFLMQKGSEVIAAGQRAGTIRDDVRPDFVIIGFLSLVSQWFHGGRLLMLNPDSGDAAAHDRDYLAFILDVYLRGIST
ncbi:MAG: hypothetical protein AAF997_24240, partial [Myxococcota bacterium]